MISKFTGLGISEDVAKAMDDVGWEEPTPIQVATIPQGLEGIDLFGQAQTGTGKTGAYASIVLGRIPAGACGDYYKAIITVIESGNPGNNTAVVSRVEQITEAFGYKI